MVVSTRITRHRVGVMGSMQKGDWIAFALYASVIACLTTCMMIMT
jgi:hypothetical protein